MAQADNVEQFPANVEQFPAYVNQIANDQQLLDYANQIANNDQQLPDYETEDDYVIVIGLLLFLFIMSFGLYSGCYLFNIKSW